MSPALSAKHPGAHQVPARGFYYYLVATPWQSWGIPVEEGPARASGKTADNQKDTSKQHGPLVSAQWTTVD